MRIYAKHNDVQAQCIALAHLALTALLMARNATQTATKSHQSAITNAKRSLALAEETARTRHPHERDFVRAHWLLGAALCASGQLDEAEKHLSEALSRCRTINLVEMEADILLNLARLRVKQGQQEDSVGLAGDALAIAERCGYVLQAADIHLFFATLTPNPAPEGKGEALEHARDALRLATCDGEPYVYRVAYDEALALVKKLEDG